MPGVELLLEERTDADGDGYVGFSHVSVIIKITTAMSSPDGTPLPTQKPKKADVLESKLSKKRTPSHSP